MSQQNIIFELNIYYAVFESNKRLYYYTDLLASNARFVIISRLIF